MENEQQFDAKDEKEFQSWIKSTGWYKEYVKDFKEEPDLNIPEYDYRAAWKAGVQPERDKFDQNRYHWPSVDPTTGKPLKSANHPTAWKEEYMSATGNNPDEVGVTKQDFDKLIGTKALTRSKTPGTERLK